MALAGWVRGRSATTSSRSGAVPASEPVRPGVRGRSVEPGNVVSPAEPGGVASSVEPGSVISPVEPGSMAGPGGLGRGGDLNGPGSGAGAGGPGAGGSSAGPDKGTGPAEPGVLRRSWAEGSQVCGWAFESDWDVPAVDAVVDAIEGGRDVWAAAERLGAERASAGVPLAEALTDIDVLAGLVAWQHREALVRAVSLGWAEHTACPAESVVDALTGLASVEYLRIRLGEIYRAAEVEGSSASRSHALVVVRLGRSGPHSWTQGLPMILVGDALRTVFSAGESLARIGQSVAVAVSPRDPMLARRARLLAELIAARVAVSDTDVELLPQIWIEGLPETRRAAVDLLADLAR